jgi:hypothetical protein
MALSVTRLLGYRYRLTELAMTQNNPKLAKLLTMGFDMELFQ